MSATVENHRVTMWMGGPSLLDAPAELRRALAEDLLATTARYKVRNIVTNEPRSYRAGPGGRSKFLDAVAADQIEDFGIHSPPYSPFPEDVPPEGLVSLSVVFGYRHSPEFASRIEITVAPGADSSVEEVAVSQVALISRWFDRLGAGSAFVSSLTFHEGRRTGDYTITTRYEEAHGSGSLLYWPSLQRYVRGAFWGNGLSAAVCTYLGGRDAVLRAAPAFVKVPLGTGAWLQLSASPPAETNAITRLEAYLQPVLGWSREDVAPRPNFASSSRGASAVQSVEVAAHEDSLDGAPPRTRRRTVPIKWLRASADTADGIAIHLAHPAVKATENRIVGVVEDWYADGVAGMYGGGKFHTLSGPTVAGPVLRWSVDFGLANQRQALRDLARRLAALGIEEIRQIVVGTEQVG